MTDAQNKYWIKQHIIFSYLFEIYLSIYIIIYYNYNVWRILYIIICNIDAVFTKRIRRYAQHVGVQSAAAAILQNISLSFICIWCVGVLSFVFYIIIYKLEFSTLIILNSVLFVITKHHFPKMYCSLMLQRHTRVINPLINKTFKTSLKWALSSFIETCK